jgi:hypothetical protein
VACFDYPVKGGDVTYELIISSDESVVETGNEKTTVTGYWAFQILLPDDEGGHYKLRVRVTDHTLDEEFECSFLLVDCSDIVDPSNPNPAVPSRPYIPPYTPSPGYDYGDSTDPSYPSSTNNPIMISGVGGAGGTWNVVIPPSTQIPPYPGGPGSPDYDPLHPVGPVGPGPDSLPEDFDAWVYSADIQFSNDTPDEGEKITIRGTVHADNSYFGLPVTWKANYLTAGAVVIAPTTYYYINGDLPVEISFTRYVPGDIIIEIELGPDFSDADNNNNAATRVLYGDVLPIPDKIVGFGRCDAGYEGLKEPIWGQFGKQPNGILEFDSGEKLEVQCQDTLLCNEFLVGDLWGVAFELIYTSKEGTLFRVGVCPFHAGCNRGWFFHSGDNNPKNNKPDSLVLTGWRSMDYCHNDDSLLNLNTLGYNYWTCRLTDELFGERLDMAQSILCIEASKLKNWDYKYKYNWEPPVGENQEEKDLICEGKWHLLGKDEPPWGDLDEIRHLGSIVLNAVGDEISSQVLHSRAENLESPLRSVSVPPLCDFDWDRDCDENDVQIFEAALGACEGEANFDPLADIDGDGWITSADRSFLFEIDSDDDGASNLADNCPGIPNSQQLDRDDDLVGDACDNCPDVPNPDQADSNDNGIGDACDNQPPIADAGPDQAVPVGPDCMAAVTLDGSGSTDPDGDSLTFTWTWDSSSATGVNPTIQLPLGSTTITLVVNDGTINSDPDIVDIAAVDNIPPEISLNGPSELSLECGLDTYTELEATASDNCDPTVTATIGGDTVDTSTCGTYVVTYDATDSSGNTAQVTREVTVIDTTPPEITLSASPDTLWPPNHKMVLITATTTATDNCDANPTIGLQSITVNEGDQTNTYDPNYDATEGDGHTSNDIQVEGDGTIYLRAERSGTGSGRIYTIVYSATDVSGNTSSASATVTVPHNQ